VGLKLIHPPTLERPASPCLNIPGNYI
jgi:hypothetical protein